jgi:hypothetical protein
MFLRYFVAGLTVPESFGIVVVPLNLCYALRSFCLGILHSPPSEHLRRQLIMISKVLSNLSTQVKFGEKEVFCFFSLGVSSNLLPQDYMVIMNDFLAENETALNKYYEHLCQVLTVYH